MSSRFVAEKLNTPINEGNIAFATKAFRYIIDNNKFRVYIEEIDQLARQLFNSKYANLQISDDYEILNNVFKYGDISPDGKSIVSLNNNLQICLWDAETTLLKENINLNNILGTNFDYICFVRNDLLAFVTNPFAAFNANNHFRKTYSNLKIGLLGISGSQSFDQYYFSIENVIWIDHTVIDNNTFIVISDGNQIHVFNTQNGNMSKFPVSITKKNRCCLVNDNSILYLKQDYINKTLNILIGTLHNSQIQTLTQIDRVNELVGLIRSRNNRVFLFSGSLIYEYISEINQLRILYDVGKLTISIDFSHNLNAFAVLMGGTIEMVVEENRSNWIKRDSYDKNNCLDNKVMWIGEQSSVVIFGDNEYGIKKNRFNQNIQHFDLGIQDRDRG